MSKKDEVINYSKLNQIFDNYKLKSAFKYRNGTFYRFASISI